MNDENRSPARESNWQHAEANPSRFRYFGRMKGKVEQRTDPARLGRLRCRVVGIHDDTIPVEQLPWASPHTSAWTKGGRQWIPPLGEYVWVEFEDGHVEAPVWGPGGWWGAYSADNTQAMDGAIKASDGRANSGNVVFPTTGFGGAAWPPGSILAMEQFSGVSPDDAPNNFIDRTPVGKHIELDDRYLRQKIKVSDQLDNYFWLSTEWGVATWEVSRGLRNDSTMGKPRGITLSFEEEVIQLYSFLQWQFTSSDKGKFWDWNSPTGFRIRLDEDTKRLDIWSSEGHRIILDDQNDRIHVETAGGRSFILDDARHLMQMGVGGETGGSLVQFDDTPGAEKAWIYAPGAFTIQSGGPMSLIAAGAMTIHGQTVHSNPPGGVGSAAAPSPEPIERAVYQSPDLPGKAVRGPDAPIG